MQRRSRILYGSRTLLSSALYHVAAPAREPLRPASESTEKGSRCRRPSCGGVAHAPGRPRSGTSPAAFSPGLKNHLCFQFATWGICGQTPHPQKIGQQGLRFVQCTSILLRRDNVVVADALLGRFLPRLGPLVVTQAASFVSVPLRALNSHPLPWNLLRSATLSFFAGKLLSAGAGYVTPLRPGRDRAKAS